MGIVILDPTAERSGVTRPLAVRPDHLAGEMVAIVDISKARGDVFCDRIAELTSAAGASVTRYTKPTFARPAPADLRHEIATHNTVVIQALAD